MFEVPKKVGRQPLNPRIVFNALMWILKSGARWRDLPALYGNWHSIYHKFRLWCSLGLFDRLLKAINADAKDATLLEIDSTFCKVHKSACCALKNQAIGVSRGGKNTTLHVLINEKMQLLNVVLTGGHVHDSEPAIKLLKGVTLKGKTILADISTPASISNAILLSAFFSELRITVTLPLVTTNWLFALRISFYLLLPLFTFNLPTAPNNFFGVLVATLFQNIFCDRESVAINFALKLSNNHCDFFFAVVLPVDKNIFAFAKSCN